MIDKLSPRDENLNDWAADTVEIAEQLVKLCEQVGDDVEAQLICSILRVGLNNIVRTGRKVLGKGEELPDPLALRVDDIQKQFNRVCKWKKSGDKGDEWPDVIE